MAEPTPASPARTWWMLGLGLVAIWALYLALFGPRTPGMDLSPPRLSAPAAPSPPADFQWKLLDLDGRPVDFGRYRGRAVFLNIWATWCPPCVAELPSIARLADDSRVSDVSFVCVSTDASAETVRRFLAGKGWDLTVLRATELPEVFSTQGIPATFLIAPDGRVVVSEVGAARWDDPSVVAFLEDLAKVSAAPARTPEPTSETAAP